MSCGWERSTYTLGLATYYSATEDDDAASYLQAWGEGHDYKLCQVGDGWMPGVSAASLCGDMRLGCALPGPLTARARVHQVDKADNQLCGATYIELYLSLIHI